MIKLTKGQEYIKKWYFKKVDRNPLHFAPISDESFKLTHGTLLRVIDMIINILEKEKDSEINWVKTT